MTDFKKLNKEYGLPQVFVDQLEVVANNVMDNRADCLGLFIGGERLGKSTLQSRVALCLADFMHTPLKLKRDYYYDIYEYVEGLLKIRYDDNPGNQFKPAKGGKHYIKVFDEPVMGAFSRNWNSKNNILLNKTFATIGYKYLIMLASIPDFFMLDSMVREHRVAFLCKVTGLVDEKGYIRKGYFSIYNGNAVKKIYRHATTNQAVYPITRYSHLPFTSLEGQTFWKEYEEFSAKAKEEGVAGLLEATHKAEGGEKAVKKYMDYILSDDGNGK